MRFAAAGGEILEINEDSDFDVLVIGDDSGFDLLPTMNALITATHWAFKKNRQPKFLLANPDLLYPRSANTYGFTSGSLAKLLEIGLRDLHPENPVKFEVLGKPSSLLFDLALERSNVPREKTIMFGDQIHTDVAGANQAKISSALLATGIAQWPLPASLPAHHSPTYFLQSLVR